MMNKDLEIFSYWVKLNRLTVNIDKTKFMLINSNRKINLNLASQTPSRILYDLVPLEQVTKYEYVI